MTEHHDKPEQHDCPSRTTTDAQTAGAGPGGASLPSAPASPKGKHSIPDDWQPNAITRKWVFANCSFMDELQYVFTLEEFRDYWQNRAEAGDKEAQKTGKGWELTFKNRVRSSYFQPMPPHVRQAREAERNKKLDEIEYDVKKVVEVGPAMKVAKLPFEE